MVHTSYTITGNVKAKADVCVIGSGAGGAAVAGELAKRGARVIIIEEGGHYTPDMFVRKIAPSFKNLYQMSGMRVMTGESFIPLPGGRCVGGSTLINSAICFRAPDYIFETWAEKYGLSELSPEAFAKAYDGVEAVIKVAQCDPEVVGENNLIFKRGAEALGLKGNLLWRNAPDCMGCGVCQFGCPIGAKRSMDISYIPVALAAHAELYADARAEKLVVHNGRVKGLKGSILDRSSGKPKFSFEIEAPKVVLSGSTIGSPIFLQKNEIANSSGQVGKNLHVHPGAGAAGLFTELIEGWKGIPQGYYLEDYRDQGILVHTFFGSPDIFYAQMPFIGHEGKSIMSRYKNMAGCGAIVSDTGTGEVKVGSGWKPKIKYNPSKKDLKRLTLSIGVIGKVYFAAGADSVICAVHGAGIIKNEKELDKLVAKPLPQRSMLLYASHPMGTCRMGAKKEDSVIGPNFMTHDVENLFIADGSVFPSSLGVNPQLTTMAVGFLAAESISGI